MALGDLVGETVGGSAQNKAFADYMRGAEFQSILRGYSYLFSSTTTPAGGMPVGSVLAYAAAGAPSGWLTCDNTAYSQDQYSALFDVIARTYGGDATARTFLVPDLRARGPIGPGGGRSVTQTGGAETHKLLTDELPIHNHTLTDNGHEHRSATTINGDWVGLPTGYGEGGWATGDNPGYNNNISHIYAHSNTTGISIASAGSDLDHNNMQPFIVLSYIIKAV